MKFGYLNNSIGRDTPDNLKSEITTMEYLENTKLIDAPLAWQAMGLQETATGYGSKLTTRYKVEHKGRRYRVYASRYGNCSSLFIVEHGKRIYLNV